MVMPSNSEQMPARWTSGLADLLEFPAQVLAKARLGLCVLPHEADEAILQIDRAASRMRLAGFPPLALDLPRSVLCRLRYGYAVPAAMCVDAVCDLHTVSKRTQIEAEEDAALLA